MFGRKAHRFAGRAVQIAQGKLPEFAAFGKSTIGFERVCEVDDAVEWRHRVGAGRVLFDRRKHVGIVDAEIFTRDRRAEPSVKQRRMFALDGVDCETARFGFRDQSLRRVQAREIVQHARDPGFARIDAVAARERFGAARDAQAMPVAMFLSDLLANSARQFRKRHPRVEPSSTRERSTRSRLR